MPRRPARPVSWVYSAAVISACVSPFHLLSRSITTRSGRHVDTQRQGLGREDTHHQPPGKQVFNDLFEHRQQPSMVRSETPPEPFDEVVVLQDMEIVVAEVRGALLDDLPHDLGVFWVVQSDARLQQLTNGAVTTGTREDEVDRREQVAVSQGLDDVSTARYTGRTTPTLPTPWAMVTQTPESFLVAGEPLQFRVDLLVLVVRKQVVELASHHDLLPERDWPVLGDDHRRTSSDGLDPGAELLGVAHRG